MTKIEEVARAIYDADHMVGKSTPWERNSAARSVYTNLARAAIKAMPLDCMIEVLVTRAVGSKPWNARADALRDELRALAEEMK